MSWLFSNQTVMELKLLFKLKWPFLLPLAAGIWMLIHTQHPSATASQDINLYAYSEHSTILLFSTVVPVLLGVLTMRRDLLHPAYEWMLRLPIGASRWIMAKWLAGFIYMSLFTLAVSLGYCISAIQMQLPVRSMLRMVLQFSLIYEQSYGICLALGIFLGILLPLRFALPIAVCGWMFGSIFLQLYVVRMYGLNLLKAFYLQPLIDAHLLENEVWSSELARGEQLTLLLFVAAFALFLLVCAKGLLGKVRPTLNRHISAIAALVSLAVAAIAFVPYERLVLTKTTHLEAVANNVQTMDKLQPNNAYAFKIDRVDLTASQLADDTLKAHAVISVPILNGSLIPADPHRDSLKTKHEGYATFLLYPSLNVDAVTLNGSSSSWKREGDQLSIPIPSEDTDEPLSISIEYHGKINEWTRSFTADNNRDESFMAFLHGSVSYLPASIGWYPLPGGDSLLYKRSGRNTMLIDRRDTNRFTSAIFDVTLTGFKGPVFASLPASGDNTVQQHFTGEDASGITIFGGDFQEVRIPEEPISIITTSGNEKESIHFLENILKRRQYYESMMGAPLGNLRQIIYFPMDLIRTKDSYNQPYVDNDTFVVPESRHGNLDSYLLDDVTSILLFGDIEQRFRSSYRPQVPSLIWEVRETFVYMYNKYLETSSTHDNSLDFFSTFKESADWEIIKQMIETAVDRGEEGKVWSMLSDFRRKGLKVQSPITAPGLKEAAPYEYPIITQEDWLNNWLTYLAEDNIFKPIS